MTLKVNAPALGSYAYVLTAMAEAADSMAKYEREWSTFDFAERGILGQAEYAHDAFANDVQAAICHLREVLTASSEELHDACDFYLYADHTSAALLDESYPAVQRASLAGEKRPRGS